MSVPMLVAVVIQMQVAAAAAPSVTIPRLEAAAVIDGKLDDAVWQQAARLSDFRQYQPVDGRPAEEKTEVLVWYAPDAIHFGIVASDREPESVRATHADRDNIDGEDHVIIYLDTFNDRRRAFFFAVNALGVQADGVRTEGSGSAGRMFGNNTDYNPDYIFESKGARTSSGYVVEVRIPFKSLRYPASGPLRWGLQVERLTQRTGYTDTWTDVKRASASFLLQAGTMEGLRDLERGVVMEAQPFLTTTANGALQSSTGQFLRDDPNAEVGANLRLSFANAALDATINPDFSQVESDAGQVTVNERFALFFPEKRPFFLEGIELFNTPNQLVYTRQVAEPIAGGKLTGKIGPLSVAHLTALDEDAEPLFDTQGLPAGARNALFNITRIRTDFGSSSTAGLLLSDRSVLESAAYNRVAAADVRVVYGKLYFTEVQLGNSWTQSGNQKLDGPIWKVSTDRTGRRWGFNYNLNGISDQFRTRAGFVPRTGVVNGHAFNRLSFYGQPGALLESLTTFMGPTRYWRYDDFGKEAAIEGGESMNTTFRLRGGWNLQNTVGRTFFHFDPALFPYTVQTAQGVQPYQPLASTAGVNLQAQFNTPIFRGLDANLTLARNTTPIHAEGAAGYTWNTTGALNLRPTRSLRLGWTAGRQQLNRTRTQEEFARTLLSRLSAEYQPTRALFFRAVSEYRHERLAQLQDARTGSPLLHNGQPIAAESAGSLRIDLLTSYEPSPGTVAFFGYGASLLDDPLIADSWQRQSDGFFIKLAYQFRR